MDEVPKPHQTATNWSAVTKLAKDDYIEDTVSGSDVTRVKFYEDHSGIYEDDMALRQYNGARYAAITLHKYLEDNTNAEILDVGAGSGLISKQLRALGNYPNVDGLDPCANMLKIGKDKGLFRDVKQQYFYRDSGLDADKYDAIVTSGTFVTGHLKSDVLHEFHRVVKSGGIFVVAAREQVFTDDEDLRQVPEILNRMVSEGKLIQLEHSVIPAYNISGVRGIVYAFKKS